MKNVIVSIVLACFFAAPCVHAQQVSNEQTKFETMFSFMVKSTPQISQSDSDAQYSFNVMDNKLVAIQNLHDKSKDKILVTLKDSGVLSIARDGTATVKKPGAETVAVTDPALKQRVEGIIVLAFAGNL